MGSNWTKGKLEELAIIEMGQSPLGETCNQEGIGTPLLNGPTEFSGYYPTPVQFTTDARKFSVPDDILFCVRGSTTGRMNWADQKYAIGRGIAAMRHRSGSEYRYFLKALIDFHLYKLLASATGSTFPNVSREQLANLDCEIPPLPEQRAIAGILGALDDKIEVNRRMNATLESMARAVFRQWFVENEEVGGWEVGSVVDDFNLTMGQSPPGQTYNENGEGIPFFQGRADFGTRFPSNRVYCSAPTRFANSGDTLVCVRAPVGDLNMASEKCAIGRGVAAIRHKTGSRSYTYYTMLSLEENFKQFEAEGTVFGSINKIDFQNLKVVIPPSAIVEKFEEICFPLDQMIENNEKESRTLASLRDSLLPKLMRDEVRVSEL